MLKTYLKQQEELNEKIYLAIKCLVNEQTDKCIITLDDNNPKTIKDSISCFIFDDNQMCYREYGCVALAIFDNELCILPKELYMMDALNFEDKDILEDDEWLTIKNSQVLIAPTLNSIAQSITQYIPRHISNLTPDEIISLRKEIVLNSLYANDYRNSLGVPEKETQDFFDGYCDYLQEIAEEQGVDKTDFSLVVVKLDNESNLKSWFSMLEK